MTVRDPVTGLYVDPAADVLPPEVIEGELVEDSVAIVPHQAAITRSKAEETFARIGYDPLEEMAKIALKAEGKDAWAKHVELARYVYTKRIAEEQPDRTADSGGGGRGVTLNIQ